MGGVGGGGAGVGAGRVVGVVIGRECWRGCGCRQWVWVGLLVESVVGVREGGGVGGEGVVCAGREAVVPDISRQ